ncbi:MAG: serine/threonine protein kinase [Acidobacteria bacterium]|nr:serine/threonine protein kinase [Acidobacteriota bacterium]
MIKPGDRIEHFEILAELGRGGMGEVYLARDTRLGRQVAIKTIRHARDWSPTWKVRFLREARILSSLDHPHICRVFEYLERPDADYLVLEFVEGETLKSLIQREPPDIETCFSISRQICTALSAAHERGIVHRDVKPENIMVSAGNRVSVLDFGISRTAHGSPDYSEHLGDTPATAAETVTATITGEMVGTPAYMSPEQMRGEPLTTASDVFSLGLTLHELFGGGSVWKNEASLPELMFRRQAGEVPTFSHADIELASLIESMKDKDAARRPTASECLRQIDWLQSRPARRFRNRLRWAGVLLLAGVAAGFAFLSWRLHLEAKRANREAQSANEINQFMRNLFRFAGPNENFDRPVTAREMLDLGSRQIQDTLPNDPVARARLLSAIGGTYRMLGDYDRAEELLVEALDIRRRMLGDQDFEVAETWNQLALCSSSQRDHAKAEKYLSHYLDYCEKHLPPGHERLFGALSSMADLKCRKNDLVEALKFANRAEAAGATVDPTNRLNVFYTDALFELATARAKLSDYEKAKSLLREAIELNRLSPHLDYVSRAIYMSELGQLLFTEGRVDEARDLVEKSIALKIKALGEKHIETVISRLRYTSILSRIGQYEEAVRISEDCIRILNGMGANNTNEYALALINLSSMQREQGDFENAERTLLSVLTDQQLRSLIGDSAVRAQGNLANIYLATGRYQEAESLYVEIWDALQRMSPSLDWVLNRNNLAELCRMSGRLQEAKSLYSVAIRLAEEVAGPDHYFSGEVRRGMAVTLMLMGRISESRVEAQQAFEVQMKSLGPNNALTLDCRILLLELDLAEGVRDKLPADLDSLLTQLEELGPEVSQLRESMVRLLHTIERSDYRTQVERLSRLTG